MKNPRENRVVHAGARGLFEAVLAGPAAGCNRFTLRRIVLAEEGRTARFSPEQALVYFVHSGKAALSHGEGQLDHISPGDTAVIHSGESHHLMNIHPGKTVLLSVVSQ